MHLIVPPDDVSQLRSPRHIQIGTSNVVEVIQISTSSPAPSSTTDAPSTTNNPTPPSITATTPLPASDNPTSAPPSPVTSTSTSSSTPTVVPSAAARRGPNVPVIAGSIVGAIVLLGLLATLVVFITRKREKIKKRFTFHKDMMVQRRQSRHPSIPVSAPATTVPPPYPFTAAGGLEAQTPARPESNVQGLHSAALPPSSRPLGTGHIVPSPRGPRGPAIKRTEQTVVTSTPPALDHVPSRTRRQRELTERITQLREQIGEMHRIARPDATQRAVMDDMQRQMVWLRDQENSAWALEQTNNPPPGYARYMTP
ncbi:unnamed protein product [Cyclocybe aegerita]|uniref:Transmembrane protein n=1 Tax=Cyclocybe aegerita TaxID=1973307 RepID=A0A8S0WGG2_CYCAE|nr:unnamed protein product [Cyclocybe aegerita]